MQVILGALNELGYDVNYEILNAADFGLPQNRRRVIFVGFLKNLDISFEFLKETLILKFPYLIYLKITLMDIVFQNTFKNLIYLKRMMVNLKLSIQIVTFK